MQHTDRAAFKALLGDVMGFYRQDVSTFALSVWWQACEHFDIEQVRKALTAHAMDPEHGRFAPKPADIVRHLQGTATDRSLIAWGKVLHAMQSIGSHQSVVFDDPAIHLAITDMGGWPEICGTTLDEMPFVQRRFCDTHRAYSMRPDTPHPPKLVGSHEENNTKNGFDSPPPLLVGNEAQAMRVMQLGSNQRLTIKRAGDALPLVEPPRRLA